MNIAQLAELALKGIDLIQSFRSKKTERLETENEAVSTEIDRLNRANDAAGVVPIGTDKADPYNRDKRQ
jgi:hypothetical protein